MVRLSRISLTALLIYICATITASQQNRGVSTEVARQMIPNNSKIYIARMTGGLEDFIATEIIKRKLPIELVSKQIQADYIMFGSAEKTGKQWYSSKVMGVTRNKNEGSIQILKVNDKIVIWSGRSGDRSLRRGMPSHGGQRKVAERLVEKMQKDLFRK